MEILSNGKFSRTYKLTDRGTRLKCITLYKVFYAEDASSYTKRKLSMSTKESSALVHEKVMSDSRHKLSQNFEINRKGSAMYTEARRSNVNDSSHKRLHF